MKGIAFRDKIIDDYIVRIAVSILKSEMIYAVGIRL